LIRLAEAGLEKGDTEPASGPLNAKATLEKLVAKRSSFRLRPCPKCRNPIPIASEKHESCGWETKPQAPSAAIPSQQPKVKKRGRPAGEVPTIAVGMRIEEELIERLRNAVWHIGHGLTITSIIGQTLERELVKLEKSNGGKPFPPRQGEVAKSPLKAKNKSRS
jgi:hypothetical protein